jgi:hypothetical protein
MHDQEARFRLSIPIEDAFAFAMGESDLNYSHVTDEMRQVIGFLVIDTLEYGEQWRVAAEARACLAARWPECFSFYVARLRSRVRFLTLACHPEAGGARRGISQLQFALARNITRNLTEQPCCNAEAIDRLRGPSARCASLGMTYIGTYEVLDGNYWKGTLTVFLSGKKLKRGMDAEADGVGRRQTEMVRNQDRREGEDDR